MRLRTVDTALLHQAVVTGRIADGLTGRRVPGTVTLTPSYRRAGESELRPFPGGSRIHDNGYYALAGDPNDGLPTLAAGQELELRLRVQAEGYSETESVLTLSAAQLARAQSDEDLAGYTVEVERLQAPPARRNIDLLPEPVSLAGKVIAEHDLDSPVAGASVSITAPAAAGPVSTDARGEFRIEDLPVAVEVTVEIAIGGVTESVDVMLDYRRSINQRTFSISV